MGAKNTLYIRCDLCDRLPYSCLAVVSEFVEKCWERQEQQKPHKQQREHTPELKNSYKESGDGGQ